MLRSKSEYKRRGANVLPRPEQKLLGASAAASTDVQHCLCTHCDMPAQAIDASMSSVLEFTDTTESEQCHMWSAVCAWAWNLD